MKTISEKNKLIIEFMGLKPKMEGPDVYTYNDGVFFMCREDSPEKVIEAMSRYVKYNSSWDWLMPVVSKITTNEKYIGLMQRENIMDTIPYGLMDDVYEYVIQFIEWYKNNE